MNKQTLDFIKKFEGVVLKVYLDSAGLPTMGCGHLLKGSELKTYKVGQKITQELSDELLANDLRYSEVALNSVVKVPLTENQRSSLISLIFNIGGRAFAGSTVLRKLNQKNYESCANHFLDWVKARSPRTGKLVTVRGLVIRRTAEKALFEKK